MSIVKLALIIVILVGAFNPRAVGENRPVKIFTTAEDYNMGALIDIEIIDPNKNHTAYLNLSRSKDHFPSFLWVTNFADGTVSKIDTDEGLEIARYKTGPQILEQHNNSATNVPNVQRYLTSQSKHLDMNKVGRSRVVNFNALKVPRGEKFNINISKTTKHTTTSHYENIKYSYLLSAEPTATAVDYDGNVWVANSGQGSVIKILANGGYDFNQNGKIDTCWNTNGNGHIGSGEILAWGDDERVVMNINVGNITSEPVALAIDKENRLWVGLYNEYRCICLDTETGEEIFSVDVKGQPSYCIVDDAGILWCINNGITQIDTNRGRVIDDWEYHGFALSVVDQAVYLSLYNPGGVLKIDRYTGELIKQIAVTERADDARGMVYDTVNKKLWVTNRQSNSVSIIDTQNDEWIGEKKTDKSPIGATIDNRGHLWFVCHESNDVVSHHIDGNKRGAVQVGTYPNTVSDMTGYLIQKQRRRSGSWHVIYDSQKSETMWDTIKIEMAFTKRAAIEIKIRASEDKALLAALPFRDVISDIAFNDIHGRYLEIEISVLAQMENDVAHIKSIQLYESQDFLVTDFSHLKINPTTIDKDLDLLISQWIQPFVLHPLDFYFHVLDYTLNTELLPKERISVAVFYNFAPNKETHELYNGPWEKITSPTRKTFSLQMPPCISDYKARLILYKNDSPFVNFYGKPMHIKETPEIIAWAEIPFTVTAHNVDAITMPPSLVPVNMSKIKFANQIWAIDHSDATEFANQQNKPVLVCCLDPSQPTATKFEKILINASKTLQHFVLVFVDTTLPNDLANKYSISKHPVLLIFDAYGNFISKTTAPSNHKIIKMVAAKAIRSMP